MVPMEICSALAFPMPSNGTQAEFRRRKPRLLFRLPGSFLFRQAERRFRAGLFQLPPRITRVVPFDPHRLRKSLISLSQLQPGL